MGPNKDQIVLIVIIAILWLGVMNLIYLDALKKQKKFTWKMILFPSLIKFDRNDWMKALLVMALIVGLTYLIILLEPTR
jgi:hypothetical protein